MTKILEIGEQMRLAICGIVAVLGSVILVGCGQSGELQLANSQDYDQRAKYLLYSNDDKKAAQSDKKVSDQSAVPDHTAPVSQVNSN